jgi:hypothetical protein
MYTEPKAIDFHGLNRSRQSGAVSRVEKHSRRNRERIVNRNVPGAVRGKVFVKPSKEKAVDFEPWIIDPIG